MVVIEFTKGDLLSLVKKEMSKQEIEEVLFLLKCETEWNEEMIQCEFGPDRQDMFSVEGIARAVKGYLGLERGVPKYSMEESKLVVKTEEPVARPFIACAIIEDVNLTDDMVKSLMQMQEKLHGGIGRNRKKAAIGVHDFDRTKGNFLYKDVDPEKMKFVPLGEKNEMFLREVLEKHTKGIEFKHLLEHHKTWPAIVDDHGVVSFPPIINSERTRVSDKTKNLFIDVTGTDKNAVMHSLNIIVTNILERTGKLKSVKVDRTTYPDLEPKQWTLDISDVNKILGFNLDEKQIADALERMRHTVMKFKGGKMSISVAPYRTDILHTIDLIEDIAVGYGYNNIEPEFPKSPEIGCLSKLEEHSEKVREVMIGLDLQEYSGFILTNKSDLFDKMGADKKEVAEILNPVTADYSICRSWLLPSIMKMLAANKHREYPQKVFEIGDCVILDDESETMTKNNRKLVGAIAHDKANLTEMKSVVEALLTNLGVKYKIEPWHHKSFIENRCGEIFSEGRSVGFFGEIHPQVLENWKLERPVIAFEIDLDAIR